MSRRPPHDAAPEGSLKASQRVATLNLPLLLGTIVALLVLAPAGRFWHSYQVRRASDALLERAQVHEKSGQFTEASQLLYRYLQLNPADAKVRIHLAESYDRSAGNSGQTARAIELYYQAIGVVADPQQPAGIRSQEKKLRMRLGELLLKAGRYAAVRQLFDSQAQTPESLRLVTLARYGELGNGSIAREEESRLAGDLLQALVQIPADLQLTCALSDLCRNKPEIPIQQEDADAFRTGKSSLFQAAKKHPLPDAQRASLADLAMNKMVDTAPKSVDARLARYEYRVRYSIPGAVDDLAIALQNGPKDRRVLLAAAQEVQRNKGSLPQSSEEYCRRAIAADPADERAYGLLGRLYLAQGDLEKAITTWREGLEKADPQGVDLNICLADALIRANRLNEVRPTGRSAAGAAPSKSAPLDVLRQVLRQRGPLMPADRRVDFERLVDLIEARWLIGTGQFVQALAPLKRVTSGRPSTPLENQQLYFAWYLMGQAYRALNQMDLAAAAFEQGAMLQPNVAEARAQAGAARLAIGQLEQAMAQLEQAVVVENRADTWRLLAEVRLRQQAAMAPNRRDWQPFRKALDTVQQRIKEVSQPWQVPLLEANYLRLSGSPAARAESDAASVLSKAEATYGNVADFWYSLVPLYQQLGKPADADRAVAQFERLNQQPMASCLLRVQLLLQRKQFDQAREMLRTAINRAAPGSSSPLLAMLVQVEFAAGNLAQAKTELVKLEQSDPSNVAWLTQLADLALQSGDIADLEKWETRLRQQEGAEGTQWKYYRARRLLASLSTEKAAGDSPSLVEADQLSAELLSRRPNWPKSHLLQGMVLEFRGHSEDAVAAYGQAVRLGANDLNVCQRLVRLLYGLQQFSQAETYLAEMKRRGVQMENLVGLESHIVAGQAAATGLLSERQDQLQRAVTLAEQACQSHPQDPLAWIWLGRLQLASSLMADTPEKTALEAKAEKTLQEALRLAPKDVRSYTSLFGFYQRTGRRDAAAKILQDLAEKVDLAAPQRAAVLAAGYEELNDPQKATEWYRKAAELDPKNLAVKQRLVALLARTDSKSAEKVLRGMRQDAGTPAQTKQFADAGLAEILAAQALAATGEQEEQLWREVEALVGPRGERQTNSPSDRRLYATILYRRGGREHHAAARQLLQGLLQDPKAATDFDRLLLARLDEDEAGRLRAEGKLDAAKVQLAAADQQYQTLIRRDHPNAAILVAYAEFLLRHGRQKDLLACQERFMATSGNDATQLTNFVAILLRSGLTDAATAPLARLEANLGDTPTTVGLRARWLEAQGKTAQIAPLVERLASKLSREAAGDKAREAAALVTAGNLGSAVHQSALAEQYYRRAFELAPETYPMLAGSLASQGRFPQAIQLCLDAAQKDSSPRPAMVAASLLSSGVPGKEHFQQAEELFAKALKLHPEDVNLLSEIATVRIAQGQADEAIALYRRALGIRPKELVILNNLATIRSEQPGGVPEALECIDRAIELGGPQPLFLDTKGTILLYAGKPAEALHWLETATTGPKPDPRFYFHLAYAYDRLKRVEDARRAMALAKEGGLARQLLTKKELQMLADLETRISGGPQASLPAHPTPSP